MERTERRRRDARQPNRPRDRDEKQEELDQRIVDVTRVAKVIKGGRRFAFRALIVVGNNAGKVGIGMGKARGVQDAIRKATERARNNMKDVQIVEGTIPHEVMTKFGGAKVMLKPASPGTGIKAGGGVRAVLEAAGLRDVLTKSLGSSSKMNATYATFKGLLELKKVDEEAQQRGKSVTDVQPFWRRGDGSHSQQQQ
jgi:small subunit ribosomal protein S5